MVSIGKHSVLMYVSSIQKIFDITAAEDDAEHTCSIAAFVPPNAILLIGVAPRMGGTNNLRIYPDSDASNYINCQSFNEQFILPITNQEFKYKKADSADDFDVVMHGYFVEGPVGN